MSEPDKSFIEYIKRRKQDKIDKKIDVILDLTENNSGWLNKNISQKGKS